MFWRAADQILLVVVDLSWHVPSSTFWPEIQPHSLTVIAGLRIPGATAENMRDPNHVTSCDIMWHHSNIVNPMTCMVVHFQRPDCACEAANLHSQLLLAERSAWRWGIIIVHGRPSKVRNNRCWVLWMEMNENSWNWIRIQTLDRIPKHISV